MVGGFESQQKNIGQQGVIYSPVPKQRQAAAVAFLIENAFATPKWAIDKDLVRRIEPVGTISRIGNAQRSVLNNLSNSARFARLVEQETLDGPASYTPAEFVVAVRRGIWRELENPHVVIDAYRRQLQRNYLELVNSKINGAEINLSIILPEGFPMAMFASSGDEKVLYRAELRSLNNSISVAMARTSDRETRAHLEGARDRIASILDPKFASSQSGAGSLLRIFADRWSGQPPLTGSIVNAGSDGFADAPQFTNAPWDQMENCWPDYAIAP